MSRLILPLLALAVLAGCQTNNYDATEQRRGNTWETPYGGGRR